MNKHLRKLWIILLASALLALVSGGAWAATDDQIKSVLEETAASVYKSAPAPGIGAVGGEWAVLGLARSGYQVPGDYFAAYCQRAEDQLAASGGVLHQRKYSEYSRVIIGLAAAGYDPTKVGGYDLTLALADYQAVVWQGINGPVFALLALDCGDYAIPVNPAATTQATRQLYVDFILSQQLAEGGFSLTGAAPADADVTAMAVQALANYTNQAPVAAAINQALSCLSTMQDSSGGFGGDGASCESTVQAILALGQLGISVDDSRFVKNGRSLADNLLTYYLPGQGFRHVSGGQADAMATEQALCALASLWRQDSGLSAFYDINGLGDGSFAPNALITRAQYAALVVKALGLTPSPTEAGTVFADVAADAWYAPDVAAAYQRGIIRGRSATVFDPDGNISKEHAALITARAAALLGRDWPAVETSAQPITRAEVAGMLYDMLNSPLAE